MFVFSDSLLDPLYRFCHVFHQERIVKRAEFWNKISLGLIVMLDVACDQELAEPIGNPLISMLIEALVQSVAKM